MDQYFFKAGTDNFKANNEILAIPQRYSSIDYQCKEQFL